MFLKIWIDLVSESADPGHTHTPAGWLTCLKIQKVKKSKSENIFLTASNLKKNMSELPCYTILSLPTDLEAPNEQQLKTDLEKGDTKTKIAALKKVLHLILNGDKFPGILMTIIRFVLPSQVSFYSYFFTKF